jgi:hypothetical protein
MSTFPVWPSEGRRKVCEADVDERLSERAAALELDAQIERNRRAALWGAAAVAERLDPAREPMEPPLGYGPLADHARGCSGPCAQGRAACSTPEACEIDEEDSADAEVLRWLAGLAGIVFGLIVAWYMVAR